MMGPASLREQIAWASGLVSNDLVCVYLCVCVCVYKMANPWESGWGSWGKIGTSERGGKIEGGERKTGRKRGSEQENDEEKNHMATCGTSEPPRHPRHLS